MTYQLTLFDRFRPRQLNIPDTVQDAMAAGAHLVISVSGGKDSDAMTWVLRDWHRAEGFTGDICLIHADLGRMEWMETPAYVESLTRRTGLPLHVVRHHKHDLLAGIQERMLKRPDAPPCPSSAARWCTSDFKRAPISKWIRNQYPDDATVICAIGMRADESAARAKKPVLKERKDCCAPTKNRIVYDWLPIHHWVEDEVWEAIDHLGDGLYHVAYDRGNDRLSCALCVLGCRGDLRNGAHNRPDTYRALVQIEDDSGFTFQQGLSLREVAPELLEATYE